jgi:hypothetical protein
MYFRSRSIISMGSRMFFCCLFCIFSPAEKAATFLQMAA